MNTHKTATLFGQNSVAALATEFEKLSRIMGAKDTNTTFSGDGAYTDGKTINLPAMDMTADVDPQHQAIMRGYHIHEVAHVTDTDFGTMKKRKAKHLHSIWNCCEDVFIERKAIEKYAGAKKNLQATIEHVLGEENKHWANNPQENEARLEKWWQEIPYAALQQARKNMGYESEALDEYLASLPPQLTREARRYAKSMVAAENSEEAYKLARVINRRMNALGKEAEEQEQQTPKGVGPAPNSDDADNEDQRNPEGGAGSAEAQGDQDDAPQADGSGDGDSDGESKDDGDGTPNEGDSQGRKGFSLEDAEERAQGALNNVFGKYQSGNEKVKTHLATVHKSHRDVWSGFYEATRSCKNKSTRDIIEQHWRNPVTAQAHTARRNENARRKITNDVQQYSARLARLLLAQEDRRNEGGYASGRVDRRRLAQLVAGNPNVFARPSITRTSETRIMLAVDGSSSMSWDDTVAAILCVSDCLGRANVRFDVSEWGGLDLHAFWGNTWIVNHKTANEGYKKLDSKLMFQPVGGNTPSYSALMTYAHMMSDWTEPRKVLFFLTDGEPDGYYEGEPKMCKELATRMAKSGIEVYGVGIGTSDKMMGKMFDKYVCTDFSNLGKTLLGGLEKLLLEEGHAHAA